MTLNPLTQADAIIQFHVACAVVAVILGPYSLYGRRKALAHKVSGYVWITSMTCVAVSSFFISGFAMIGPFGPIHLLSVLVLWSIFDAMRSVFAGDITRHRLVMRNLYWYGVIIASLFNFLPGRTVNQMLFRDMAEMGYVVIATGIFALIAAPVMQRRRVGRLQHQ